MNSFLGVCATYARTRGSTGWEARDYHYCYYYCCYYYFYCCYYYYYHHFCYY